jgi:hypothetical protein
MKSGERRERLLKIMGDLHSRARTQADFTAEMVAEIEGISTVLVYRLVGPEFKELRGQLPGPRRSPSTAYAELKLENERLKARVRELEAERAITVQTAIAGAHEVFERLDEDIRRWRSRCEMLERRLQEKAFIVVETVVTEGGPETEAKTEDSPPDQSDEEPGRSHS